MNRIKILCDFCSKDHTYDNSPMVESENLEVWFADVEEWLFLHDKKFCDVKCFTKYIQTWYRETKRKITRKTS